MAARKGQEFDPWRWER